MSERDSEALYARARSWAAADPDPVTRAELEALSSAHAERELEERMSAELDFGTAGLRGAVGAGPARMNRAVVVRTVRALAEVWLAHVEFGAGRPVVIGYDARPSSRPLAEAAAGVLVAAGLRVCWFEEATPTPLVAYAARALDASLALVLTASHNPRADNGLKVYGPDACQLGAPLDREVAGRREGVGPAGSIACFDLAALRQRPQQFQSLGPELAERYLSEVIAALPKRDAAPALRIAYTPVHGVGLALCKAALAQRGFHDFHAVAEQAEPDGSFPTTEFPNPEQPGTLDLALALGERVNADVVLANDPDADRLAAAARNGAGALQVLSGNELGALLADFVLDVAPLSPPPLLVTSIVTSPLVARIAAARGARVELTLTGFKWIWRAALTLSASGSLQFAFGCEEALGYSIGSLVRDKDGISAASWLAELAERCRVEGQSLFDRLGEIQRRHGAWSSVQRSLVRSGNAGQTEIGAMLSRLASAPPRELSGLACTAFVDYREGAEKRAPWLGRTPLFELGFAGGARVLVRPSGTEPKLKIYADAVTNVAPDEGPERARARALQQAEHMASAMVDLLTAS